MRWPWTKRHEELIGAINTMIASHDKTNLAVMTAVTEMAQASAKQADVLNQYLKLFQSPEDPVRWERDPEQENQDQLIKMGFPKDGTDSEQAAWVLDNISSL
jgi:ribosomal protein S12 methylthiotransferase accessory factor YcaO